MDLLDAIEGARFLGREFLVWLWYESERREGVLPLAGGERCELWLEEQLTLVADAGQSESKLKAGAPSASPEAKEALRQGKLPTKAKIRLARGPQTWGFLFDADTLGLAGVKVPALIKEDGEEKFYERIQLVEDLEEMLGALYERFLHERTSPAWHAETAPAIRAWVHADPA
jgi:hypothetical protein